MSETVMRDREEAMVRELKFVGTEDDRLLLVDPQGEQFAVPVTPELRQAIRVRRPLPSAAPRSALPAPREVQQLLRSGLTSEQVADHFGVEAEYIAKFEAPVIAELEHMVDMAQEVPLHFNEEGAETSTFGHIIAHRLVNRGAEHTMWSSWREDDGRWTVQVAYTADDADRAARWFFDPRRRQLTPANEEADQLSSAQDLEPVKPVRLRLVDAATTVDTFPLESSEEEDAAAAPSSTQIPDPATARADGARLWENALRARHGQHDDRSEADASSPARDTTPDTSARPGRVTPTDHVVRTAPDGLRGERPKVHSETEDLLQALRRRHDAEKKPESDEQAGLRPASPARLHVVPEQLPEAAEPAADHPGQSASASDAAAPRKGRPSLPSWDEIVFGTKPHDEK
ncbi:septation protein SepH [Pseudoclavibacter sp. 13-3]|uniref:septation protein SepH n=1 Tax=Pseudoclavibacter sp. 13-3 TaxID=2901228 RepID=UPI001E3F3328|nr:septation protein SepH [Pseudoclavibacter sp. 13-3]MCD7100494.1 DUF3071 domain-containing protein [Pseudoclavibacter sp. 13-3]